MPEASRAERSRKRSEALVVASVYERVVGASLERVWENVYDWEHLPWLHSEAFRSIEPRDAGDWGWSARIGLAGGDAEIELELVTDRAARRYVSRTLAGAGAPSEIWTRLEPVGEDATAIRVEFCVPPRPAATLRSLGQGYVSLYTRLWDQDEAMMQTRERALTSRRSEPARVADASARALGRLEAVRARLPLDVEFGGERFRVVEVDGALVAHAAVCPHWLGPLEDAEVVDAEIVCPWHGYRFDVRSGRSCDGRRLQLARAPRVVVDAASGEVELVAARDEA